MEKFEGRNVKYPKILKIIQRYFGAGILDVYFALEEELTKDVRR